MRVLVFGAGAIGSAFGGFLSPHHEVTLLGRRTHLEAIHKNGLRVSGIWGNHRFRNLKLVHRFDALLKEKEKFDLILVTVKSYDTESAAKSIRKILGPKTLVLSLQNGIGNIETLQAHLPKKQILAGRIIFGVETTYQGSIKITVIAEPAAIGEPLGGKITPRVKKLVKLIHQAGIPAVPTSNVQGRLWLKVIYNASLNPLASLLHCHYGKLTESVATRMLMNQVIEEVYSVMHKTKIQLPVPDARAYQKLFYSKLVPRTFNHHPSMLQDLQHGKQTEIDSITGAVVRLGKKGRVPTPINQKLLALIREKEKSHARR